jgi:uncharacterized protein (TIGR02679 family)
MALDIERLQRLLGGPELADLRRRLRARFEKGVERDEFTLIGLTAPERRALTGLLGRPAGGHAGSMRVRTSEIDAVLLRAGVASTLREALEALDGAIHDLKAARVAREEAWSALLAKVEHPRLRALVDDPTGGSLLKRLAGSDPQRATQLLESVSRVIGRLPERGLPLAHVAAAALGDAHALDSGRPVATLVLRAFGLEQSAVEGERARDQWARLGVTVNELAAPVLCLNLPVVGNAVAANLVRAAAASGEPLHLTLRMLLRDPPAWDVAGQRVYACENPSILSLAADRLGPECAPLICTSGMPAAAQQTLIRQLVAHGASVAYHGDFDWGGVRIGNFLMRELHASAWRFSSSDYEAACEGSTGILAAGERMEAVWDVQLSAAMSAQRKAVHEEALGEVLLSDLARRAPRPS